MQTPDNPVQHVPVEDSLFILWTSPDPDVARNMIFMYAHNSLRNGWWERVRLVIWGPSARLVSTNEAIRTELMGMQKDGVEIRICKACTDNYGLSSELAELGFTVEHVGKDVTDMLKAGWHHLSF